MAHNPPPTPDADPVLIPVSDLPDDVLERIRANFAKVPPLDPIEALR